MSVSQSREPDSNPLCYRFVGWAFSFSPRRYSSLSCINEYLASGGNVIEYSSHVIAAWLDASREAELVSE